MYEPLHNGNEYSHAHCLYMVGFNLYVHVVIEALLMTELPNELFRRLVLLMSTVHIGSVTDVEIYTFCS